MNETQEWYLRTLSAIEAMYLANHIQLKGHPKLDFLTPKQHLAFKAALEAVHHLLGKAPDELTKAHLIQHSGAIQ